MTLRTPDEVPELREIQCLRRGGAGPRLDAPASAGGLPGHPQVDLRVLLVRRQPQRGVRRKRPAPRLPDLARWDGGSTGGLRGDGALEICSSTLYSRICRKCGYPTENDVYCTKCANSVMSRALDPGIGRKKFDRPRPRYR